MTQKTFHFAVKPGHDPVQLPNLSAHSTMPWVARGYEFTSVWRGELGGLSREDPKSYFDDFDDFVFLWRAINECIAKSVAKPTDDADQDAASAT